MANPCSDNSDAAAHERELLSMLLEVRAHVEANGAQLDRVHAQLEWLDARVATLERRATKGVAFAVTRLEPAAFVRGRVPTLLDLPTDVLDKVVVLLDPDDELAASLACCKLRAAVRARRARAWWRPRTTRVRSLLGSLGRLRWGVACGAPLSENLFQNVAALGDLRMLSWLRARGCPWPAGQMERGGACGDAAAGGHLSVLRWLHAVGCPWDGLTCGRAAVGGHLSVLQWARANGCPWDERTCAHAAAGGHLSVLQWARANGCLWDSSTCARAADGGRLLVLKWARAGGCPWDEETCAHAAAGGHLSVLQWARANGCPWDERTCSQAAYCGHLFVLQWARANGCPWCGRTALMAIFGNHLDVLYWARANGCPDGDDESTSDSDEDGEEEFDDWSEEAS